MRDSIVDAIFFMFFLNQATTTEIYTLSHTTLFRSLRAAIEALGQGASVGVVCKSLLGKAHTVMAEGGIAAAMANVDHADRKSTRLNSSHVEIPYADFRLKKKITL